MYVCLLMYDVLCWLSFNECFDVNYDKYANEQCCVSQLLDNNRARRITALALTRPSASALVCFRTINPNPRTTQMRSNQLDEIARAHAQRMAAAAHRFHSDPKDMDVLDSTIVGENVAKGASLKEIHKNMMQTLSDRNNILDRRYTQMGMGAARSQSDGLLYLCLLFGG